MKLPSKEMTVLVRLAIRQGYTATRTGSGHVKVTGPDGRIVIVPSSPSGRRANTVQGLRRIGVKIP